MNDINKNLASFASIGRDHWDVPVRVELRAYLDFTRRMNIQLRHLTERWAKNALATSTKSQSRQHNRYGVNRKYPK